MTMGWNKILGISVPLLIAMLTILASIVPIILQMIERRRCIDENMFRIQSKGEIEFSHDEQMPTIFSIVGSVNSNNNSPYLAETLSQLLERTNELGIELNLDLRGCATIG